MMTLGTSAPAAAPGAPNDAPNERTAADQKEGISSPHASQSFGIDNDGGTHELSFATRQPFTVGQVCNQLL